MSTLQAGDLCYYDEWQSKALVLIIDINVQLCKTVVFVLSSTNRFLPEGRCKICHMDFSRANINWKKLEI
jgi:Ser/Thr protein kinase RdoA (MazF antagonist)